MLKKTAIASLVVGLVLFMGVSSFAPPPEADCGCPPGWELVKVADRANLKYDNNGDMLLCRKVLGENGQGSPNGNDKGALSKLGANYKDNNQPCDKLKPIEIIK